MIKFYDRENLASMFAAVRANTLTNYEKREFRRKLKMIERYNSSTLANSWHCVRVNYGCLSFGTIYTTYSSYMEVRRHAEDMFGEGIKNIHVRKVKAGVAIRVDIYATLKRNGGRNV